MKLIEFPEQTVVIAKDQPDYNPLPSASDSALLRGGLKTVCRSLNVSCQHQVLTFNQPLQPQLLTVEKPEMPL